MGFFSDLFGGGSKEIAQATREATAVQREFFGVAREGLSPFQQAGVEGIGELQRVVSSFRDLGIPLEQVLNFQFDPNDPAFRAQQELGTESIREQLGSIGLRRSGRGLSAIGEFTQRLLASEVSNQFGRRLSGLQGALATRQSQLGAAALPVELGAGAAGRLAGAATTTGANIGSTLQSGAALRAQAKQTGIGNITSLIGTGLQGAGLFAGGFGGFGAAAGAGSQIGVGTGVLTGVNPLNVDPTLLEQARRL